MKRNIYNVDLNVTPTEMQLAEYSLPAQMVVPLLEMNNLNEFVETRWCPFRHLRQIDFNRSYYAFTPEDKDELLQAQTILRTNKRITGNDVPCYKCNAVVNEQLRKFRPDEISTFDMAPVGVSYMDRVRCALGIECLPPTSQLNC